MNEDFRRSLACAQHYRKLGLCPLPSKMDVKGPMLPSYAEYWEKPVPESVYSEREWRTSNLQLMTGAKTPGELKVIVVDCDGPEALHRWCGIAVTKLLGSCGRTWSVVTGSGGRHYYFRLPAGVDSCPSGLIWGLWDTWGEDGRGRWEKHKEIRILGDNALAVAPPSVHVDTGKRYEFWSGCSPREVPAPAEAPDWLLALPRLAAPRFSEPPKPTPLPASYRPSGARYERREVLEAIGTQKLALAKGWGLVTKSDRPNPRGWVACFVPGREDPQHSNPSGSFHYDDGTFQDRKDLRSVSLFDLGAQLQPGLFGTWQECRDWCGDQFIRRGRDVR